MRPIKGESLGMTDKFVSVNRRNSNKVVYHTNKECQRIKSNVRLVADAEITYHELTLCTWCDPETEDPNAQYEQDHSYHEALKEAAKDD